MLLLPSRWTDLNREQLRQSLFRMYCCRSAAAQYSAKPLAVPVHLFRAEDHSDKGDPLLGWNAALPERQIRVVHIPGTHLSIMTQPTIAVLGQALSFAIQGAKPRRG
jgi:thioesterase domain-containing protein